MTWSESRAAAWTARFGSEAPDCPTELDEFLRHRSIRRFEPNPVPESVIEGLIGAGLSASTSSHLMLWSVVSVQEPKRREQIAALCADQRQVRTCAWFLAFVADHHRVAQAGRGAGIEPAGLDFAEFFMMALIDAALAAERMVCAAEAMGLGACYIGALRNHPDEVREMLTLPDGTAALFGLCLGAPLGSDQSEIKPRLAPSIVWHRESYDPDRGLGDFDDRMRDHYEGRGMAMTWSAHAGSRVSGGSLGGREVWLNFLHSQGFIRR